MFERFTDDARQAVALAQEEAVALHHGWIGTEHVLLGVLRADGDGARLLAGFGVDAAGVRDDVVRIVGRGEDDIDRDALATLGIDLEAVRERVERAFGPGALSRRGRCRRGGLGAAVPFSARAKKALELTLREAISLGERDLRAEHLVLGLLREGDGVAARVLTERGVTPPRRASGSPAATRPEASSRWRTYYLESNGPPRHRDLHRAGARALERVGPAGLPAAALLRRRRPARGRDRAAAPARRGGSSDDPDAVLDLLDGLILAGGADIDPATYGATAHPETRGTVPERDDFEIALARRALERDLPLLGICRGMQVMNVATGGTLLQHLPESHGHHEHRRNPGSFDGADHDVRLARRLAGRARRGRGAPRHEVPSPSGRRPHRRGPRGHRLVVDRRAARGLRGARPPLRARRPVASRGRRAPAASIAALVAEAAAARNGSR